MVKMAPRAAAVAEEDKRFGQPHFGHAEADQPRQQAMNVVARAAVEVVASQGDPLAVGAPLPKSIGLCADEYHRVRELRLQAQKIAEAIKARETEIKEHIISNLSKSDDSGAAGKKYRAQIVMKVKPQIADWNKLTACIQETGRFDLLQKRLGEKAVEGIWDEGFDIPGVDRINVPDVSITKI